MRSTTSRCFTCCVSHAEGVYNHVDNETAMFEIK